MKVVTAFVTPAAIASWSLACRWRLVVGSLVVGRWSFCGWSFAVGRRSFASTILQLARYGPPWEAEGTGDGTDRPTGEEPEEPLASHARLV